eukprot:CAMPEP_0181435866 /NCGR_PEP_ID=MMETSP1110-20121109/20553_1 /TAXON_ID=174948 /ORGANISM="Symbiodinium sp., Strain CCMP421" /LENGTH=140 /DNA_ID=CAMNT_0023559413 /DNA_START=61 /DNA_END=483 /DNA_ORIENTATION=-
MRRSRGALALVSLLAALPALLTSAFTAGRPPLQTTPALSAKAQPLAGAAPTGRADRSLTARRLFGLGTSELLVILGAAVLFFGPETLKGLAKEAGKAAGDLKEVPKAFEEGMSETDKTAPDAEEPKAEKAKAEKSETKEK